MTLQTIFFAMLIPFTLSNIQNLTVTQLETLKSVDIQHQRNGLVCMQLSENLIKDADFYMNLESDTGNITKILYYLLTDKSCKDDKVKEINFAELSKYFPDKKDKPDVANEEKGFKYSYEIVKKEDNQKYILLLFQDYTGDKLTVVNSPVGIGEVLVVILIIIGVIIFIVIFVIAIIIICLRKKNRESQNQYQSSFVDPIMPETKENQ